MLITSSLPQLPAQGPDWVSDLGTLILAAAAITGIIVWVIYMFGVRWWQSREGCFLWTLTGTLAWTFAYNYAALAGWLGDLEAPARAWVRLFIYSSGQVLLILFGSLFFMAQAELWKESRGLLPPWWVARREARQARRAVRRARRNLLSLTEKD